MTLIDSKKQKNYRFSKGDLLSSTDTAQLLGFKSARNFQGNRLNDLAKDFEAVGARLTTDIWIGGQRRFLRSEIDEFLSLIVEGAKN